MAGNDDVVLASETPNYYELNWETFKSIVDEHKARRLIVYIPMDNRYDVFLNLDGIILKTVLIKGTDEANDFETNYKSSTVKHGDKFDNTGGRFTRPRDVHFDGLLKVNGYTFTATANTDTVVNIPIINDIYLQGGTFYTEDGHRPDWITFQVSDQDNILGYGAGAVIATFMDEVRVKQSKVMGLPIQRAGSKIIPAGLYFTIIYHNTHDFDVDFDVEIQGHIA